jgi:hypothetical protein
MRKFLFYIVLTIIIIENGFSQNIINFSENKTIDDYQVYLINYPKTSEIIAISDTLRKMWDKLNIENFHIDCNCNCIELFINFNEKYLLEGKEVKKSELKDLLKYSIENPENLEFLPEKEVINTKFGNVIRSKGIVDIITKDINQKTYAETIEIVILAFAEIRDEWSKYYFEKNYLELNEESRNEINKIVPIVIRFERYMPWNLRMPLPPESSSTLKGLPDVNLEN